MVVYFSNPCYFFIARNWRHHSLGYGAWNSSIVSEYVNFGGKVYQITGLGLLISSATQSGNIALFASSTLFMAIIVVLFNRFF